MALATVALALEAAGNRAAAAGGDGARIGGGHDGSLARMSCVASHEALSQPHILLVRHEFTRPMLIITRGSYRYRVCRLYRVAEPHGMVSIVMAHWHARRHK